jgi:uncharacterized protein YggE
MKVLFFFLLLMPISLLAEGGLPNQPYIYVEGKAEMEKPADMVTLRFNLVARAPDEAKANEQVQAKASKIFGLIKSRKIADNDVIAGDLKSEPEYDENESSPRQRGKLIGYSVTRTFVVKVRDVTTFPKMVDEVIALGNAEFSSIVAGLTTEKQIQDEIGDKALTNARERADKTAKALGMKIDSVFAVSPVAFPEITEGIFGSSGKSTELYAEGPEAPPSQYRLAPVSIGQSVHVIYLISPAK